jgi:uncharacterized RmlC-like cupin family protein
MDQQEFTHELRDAGFDDISTVQRPPNGRLDTHAHPFEARALILSGELRIQCGDEMEELYRAGDVFHLPCDTPHTEAYGPQGVSYLVGRKLA